MSNTIELDGLTFKVEVEHDSNMGPPWEEHDGHGIVSKWRRCNSATGRRGKRPGERVLSSDDRRLGLQSCRFYDFAGTLEKAKKEGWGLGIGDIALLQIKLGREPTKREIVVEAVEKDFNYLKSWCNDEWYWCYVCVTLLDVDGNETDEDRSLGGIESSDEGYLKEVARDLAHEISRSVGGEATIPARPSTYTIRRA